MKEAIIFAESLYPLENVAASDNVETVYYIKFYFLNLVIYNKKKKRQRVQRNEESLAGEEAKR